MIWLTWRQARTQTLVVAALLAAFSVLLLATGPHLVSLYRASTFAACHRECAAAAQNFLSSPALGSYHLIYFLGAALIVVLPAVIGLFWAAPLVARELETGTYRLAWNQSVTRERWLAVKLGVLGLASMALAGVFSLILGWWASPIDHAATINATGGFEDRFFPVIFGARGIVPIGYAAFAFALGVLVGLMIRRTVPAMGITLAIIAVVQIAFPLLVRPHLIAPVRDTAVVTAAAITGISSDNNGTNVSVMVATPGLPGSWIYSDNVVNRAGSTDLGAIPAACPQPDGSNGAGTFQSCQQAFAQRHLTQVLVYQPANRYWTFQAVELGIYLTVAILLAWACFWWARRRLS